jgi:hypothetical protein
MKSGTRTRGAQSGSSAHRATRAARRRGDDFQRGIVGVAVMRALRPSGARVRNWRNVARLRQRANEAGDENVRRKEMWRRYLRVFDPDTIV